MGDFPGGPVVETSNAGVAGLIPGWGAKIPHAMWHSQKKKRLKTALRKQVERSKGLNNKRKKCEKINKSLQGYNTWLMRVLEREGRKKWRELSDKAHENMSWKRRTCLSI